MYGDLNPYKLDGLIPLSCPLVVELTTLPHASLWDTGCDGSRSGDCMGMVDGEGALTMAIEGFAPGLEKAVAFDAVEDARDHVEFGKWLSNVVISASIVEFQHDLWFPVGS